MAKQVSVRLATREDVPVILAMIKELAEYEKDLKSVQTTEADLLRTLTFASSPSNSNPQTNTEPHTGFAKTLLICPTESERVNGVDVAGMALFFYNYSTWTGAPGVYLEDLFVRPEYRRKGYATLVLKELAREVKRIGGKRLQWNCLKWNEPSLQFYAGLGAEQMSQWVGLRVTGDAVEKLAQTDA
ncbi:acyl-CoA N-acyltransferase [Viridothelium virens]|uniref:Acyl-CoA N-acyltransferase n=1 Tax=Viridothelium virens TaxID=1048519 RepID=A0A6A6GZ82_VIRVR|nr:acyl-CoA N-acyltransferase [Viridothelium virens]